MPVTEEAGRPEPALDKPYALSKLQAGDRLWMRFTSRGTVDAFTYDLLFKRDTTPTVSITAVAPQEIGFIAPYRDGPRHELGELALSESDLARLDALIRFYRTSSADGCTTKEIIRVYWIRDGAVEAAEDLRGDADRVVEGVLTIPALAKRSMKP